jgi:hypothetical protein
VLSENCFAYFGAIVVSDQRIGEIVTVNQMSGSSCIATAGAIGQINDGGLQGFELDPQTSRNPLQGNKPSFAGKQTSNTLPQMHLRQILS